MDLLAENRTSSLLSPQSHLSATQLINVSLKKGLKKKKLVSLSQIFNLFFSFLKLKGFYPIVHLKEALEIHNHNFNLNKNLYLVNFILNEIIKTLNPAFNIKLVSKKKRKKNQTKLATKINYIFPKKRLNLVYR